MYQEFSDVYDRLMRGTDYDVWASRADTLLGGAPAKILECACGTGEMTLRLYEKGYDVTASDLSGDMLRVSAEKARKRGARIPFIEQDMRYLSVHRPADAVVSFCDGVNYLAGPEALSAFLSSAHAALKAGGLLLFDVSTEYKLSSVLDCNTFGEDLEELAYLWRNNYDPKSRLIEMRLTFFVREGTGYRRFTEEQIQYAHTDEEIKKALSAAGFCGVTAFDGYTDAPAKKDSERVLYVARRSDGND